jgi:hypothetical protein
MSRLVALTCAAVAVLLIGGPAAGAKIYDRGTYSGTDEFTDNECGFPLEVDSTFSGKFQLRVLKGGQAFLARDNFSYRDVITNPETGGWFVVRGNGSFHEIKGTHVEGDIYKFVAVESGQPFVIEDANGKVIVRDRGAVRATALFDTLGDGMPGGDLLEEQIDIRGPHPSYDEDFPFCEIAAELTGATSG